MHKQNKQPYLLRMLIHVWSESKPAPISILSRQKVLTYRYPTTNDRDTWHNYWQEMCQSWRTEPEITKRRQVYLEKRRAIVPNIEQGSYPFKDMKLSRADIEWLLATHENGRGPVNWDDKNQRIRKGLDLRGANLSEEDLNTLPLARVFGGLTWEEWLQVSPKKRYMAEIRLEGTNLTDAHMEGACLGWAHLKGANLTRTHIPRHTQ